MELLLKHYNVKINTDIIDDLTFSKNQVINKVGLDFNRAVANMIGLVSLLDEEGTADPDFKTICKYLSIEAQNLNSMVKDICH